MHTRSLHTDAGQLILTKIYRHIFVRPAAKILQTASSTSMTAPFPKGRQSTEMKTRPTSNRRSELRKCLGGPARAAQTRGLVAPCAGLALLAIIDTFDGRTLTRTAVSRVLRPAVITCTVSLSSNVYL